MGQAAERGLYMIEIIREESFDSEQEKRELPKNIRQIGSPDIGDRIYIENKVHEYMHPYDALQEKTVYVLLGRFENMIGRQCVFVEAAICLEEIAFEGECPVWSDDSWAYLYKKLKHAYDNMVIVGWAMDIRGQLPNLTVAIEKLHRTYFGGEHQILYLMDSLEKEDAFYSLKNGYLKRRAGYYIYYAQKSFTLSAIIDDERKKDTSIQKKQNEKQEMMQEDNQKEKNQEQESWSEHFFAEMKNDENYAREEENEKERTNSYRTYLEQKGQKTKMIPSYGLSILLFLVVCGLGFAAFQNHQKMNAMETALMQMNSAKMTETETQTPASETESEEVDDQAAADEVAALIDAIYVQTRNENTDEQCAAAKAAWDKLTDAQKELVEGENADPDYFGRDTGDASKDDPLNEDGIGENELLVVSFGTSFNDSRAEDIGGVEKALQEANPDWSVRRAFTAQIIINHVQARDGEKIDNVEQALDRAVENGVKNLVVQPTHLMHGAEYDELVDALDGYKDKFETVTIAEPLLGEVGSDATVVNEDKAAVAEAITGEAVKTAGFDSLESAKEDGTAFVFMGHGTSHTAKVSYSQMAAQMEKLGYDNVFIGTVEGEPEETACENVIAAVKEAGYTKVILRPLMVVAGDHANNDMAGDDDDSWKSQFVASGNFESVDCQIAGLGGIDAIQQIYAAHTKAAIESLGSAMLSSASKSEALADGTYSAKFDTDSGMFHVNEVYDGRGTLTVKDGKMTLHIVMPSQNIVNLFLGTAEDAQKDGAKLIQPTTEEVTYSDGSKEEVYAFDVPVEALDQEFDLALIGTKGKWYDHKVSVSDAQVK